MKKRFSFFGTSESDAGIAGEGSSSPAEEFQRTTAAVAGVRSPHAQLHSTIGVLFIGALGVGLLTWYYSTAFSRAREARTAVSKATASKADAESILPPITVIPPAPATTTYRIGSVLGDPIGGEASPIDATSTVSAEYLPPSDKNPGAKSPQQIEEARELGGLVFARSTLRAPQPGRPDPAESIASQPERGNAESRLASLLVATPVATARASILPTQRLLLPKGSLLDCTLETAIDSSLPGLATCMTAVDTFSADGTVVLLERGTRLIGETRGEVAQGGSRIFVLWTEARTPTGVVVPVASPGTDELGRSGLPGAVNRHFWDRFGAAILVSMIDGAVQGAASNQSRGNGSIIVNPNGTREVTTEILRDTMRIAPTVVKRQGDRIQILVARDLDFRTVYQLHAR